MSKTTVLSDATKVACPPKSPEARGRQKASCSCIVRGFVCFGVAVVVGGLRVQTLLILFHSVRGGGHLVAFAVSLFFFFFFFFFRTFFW